MDVEGQGVVADSPPAETPTEPTAQAPLAPAQNGAGQGQPQERYVPYARFSEVNGRMRQYEQQAQALAREIQSLRAERQQTGQRQPSLEEQQALQALRDLQALDPEHGKQAQRLEQLERMFQGFVQQQQTVLTTQGRGQVAQMAADAGLPTDKKSLSVIENAVAVYLADNPEAVQRFQHHDLSVIKDAFKEFNDTFLGKLRRDSTAAVVEKKTAAQQIPTPARAGGPPGPAAPVKVTAANEPEVREGIRERIRAAFGQLRE